MPDAATIAAPPPASVPPTAPPPPVTGTPSGIRAKPAFERMAKELASKGKSPEPGAAQPPTTNETKPAKAETNQASGATKAAAPATEAPKTETKTASPAAEDTAPDPKLESSNMPPEMAAAVRGKDGKVQPWKLANWYKDRFGDAQAEIAKLKTTGLSEQEKAQYLTRVEAAEKKVKEFEDDLRLTNYAKSQEFKDKFEKPYTAAWERTMSELNGLTVPEEGGAARPFTTQDMLQLVSMEAIPARRLAQELYGEFANDVMLHRNEIRRMSDDQARAINDAKTTGAQREKERSEMQTKTQREIAANIQSTFKEAFQAAQKDEVNGRFFTPKEGDQEWNDALEKGRELSASVFKDDPNDPNLTPQERAAIVKKHAAVFNRSSAFGPTKRLLLRTEKRLAEVEKELEGYKGSKPDVDGGSRAPANGVGQVKARDRVFGALAQLGKLT